MPIPTAASSTAADWTALSRASGAADCVAFLKHLWMQAISMSSL
ncbi:hypothetical protein DFR75_107122 [Nocardia ignorata]|uniref:Uncharacterized protein n=1 Tax=Nocardia ignorata TaxID=145285 RepID=A0A4R6P2Y0_NOCIG|nr:hypothetical protein DFR75_107122 [Nocardia ignorata]